MPSPYKPSPDVRRWLPALYPLALVLCVVPFAETAAGLWPANVDSPAWRFGAVGIFLSFFGSTLLGLLMAVATAHALGHRIASRVLGVVAALLALFLVIICGSFALDVLQVRTIVRLQARRGFELTSAKAMVMGLMSLVTLVLTAIAAFGSAAVDKDRARRRAPRTGDLVVGAAPADSVKPRK